MLNDCGSANLTAMTRTQAVAAAIGLFAVWMLATYPLERARAPS
jgi:hypothetical protein